MPLVLRTFASTFINGHHIAPHSHSWAQLIYAVSGVMRVGTAGMLWIVPPARAIWAPPGIVHEIWAKGDFEMRTLYLEPTLAAGLPPHAFALDVTPLLRELILHASSIGMLRDDNEAETRLAGVIVDQIGEGAALPLSLPLPRDVRAVRLAERLRDDPACSEELDALSRGVGASARTMQRLFLAETGLRFAEWRQRLRLLHGASLLGAGASVTQAGLEAGYAGTSAFIAAFRKQFGYTPAQMK